MKNIEVKLGERSYPIYIGDSLLTDENLLTKHISTSQVLIVTNETIAPMYLNSLEANLKGINYETIITLIE